MSHPARESQEILPLRNSAAVTIFPKEVMLLSIIEATIFRKEIMSLPGDCVAHTRCTCVHVLSIPRDSHLR